MKDISDIFTVSFDNGLKDESALCVSRKQDGDYSILKMELGEQADILYYLLTNQIAKAEIKTEKWIPVSERLPEDGEWAIFTDGKRMSIERYKMDALDHFYPSGRYFNLEDVVAWMPLPEPFKPKEVENERTSES